VPLHPLARQFGSVADAYERGRPEYPARSAARVMRELGVEQGAPVLDLGAGTGKLTRGLQGAGVDVIAVEPQESLRGVLAAIVGEERVKAGTAESIPLADASVAAVTAADAFHWFDPAPALAEIRRVLRPGGGVAILTAMIDWRGASWAHEVGTLMAELRPEHPFFDGPSWKDSVRAAGGFGEPRDLQLTFWQDAGAQRTIDYVASMSWMAALEDDVRAQTLERIATLVREGETPARMQVRAIVGLANLEPR
jgi:SAM-dependent methyltransferase